MSEPTDDSTLAKDVLDAEVKIDANELRWLGEEADGKREADYAVVWKEVNGQRKLALEPIDTAQVHALAARFVVRTNWQGPGLRGQVPMTITWEGKPVTLFRVRNGKKEYPDSIFWTQSAFLKFVIPYYARMRSTGNLDDMRRKYFNDQRCMAVMHFEPSEDEGFAPEKCFEGVQVDPGTGSLKLIGE